MIKAEVICDSRHPDGQRLTTLRITYPTIITAEVLTHRAFSRNASSFRAIPGKRLRANIRREVACPSEWGAANKGMTSSGPMTGWRLRAAQAVWEVSAQVALLASWLMERLGAAKQVYNRPLTPYSHTTMLVTATDEALANFLHLRDHPDADPTIQALAKAIKEAMNESVPRALKLGEWHCPFRKTSYGHDQQVTVTDLIQSVARCARVSYSTFDHPSRGSSVDEDIALYEKLVGGPADQPKHASPAEHQARAISGPATPNNLGPGWLQYRKTIRGEYFTDLNARLEKP